MKATNKLDGYADKVIARISDPQTAYATLARWARHDAELAKLLGASCWLDVEAPLAPEITQQINAAINNALDRTRSASMPLETPEYAHKREEFIRNFR